MKIYKVIYSPNHRAETNWHTSKKYCQDYINSSSLGYLMELIEEDLIDDRDE